MTSFHHRIVGSPDKPEREVQFVSMEYLPGETLAERLRRQPMLSFDAAATIILQIAEGLSAAHRAGVVHRDLKPGNIMLVPGDGQERVVVTDFGLARHSLGTDISHASVTSLAGTPAYMTPEQLEGAPATFASDVYAFGVVSYLMLAGRHPRHPGYNEAAQRTPERSDPLSGINLLWKRVILRCLDRNPDKRFPSAQQVLTELVPEGDRRIEHTLRKLFSPSLTALAVLVVLGVALFLAFVRFQQWMPRIAKGSTVLLTDIRVPEPELEGVTTVLRSQLAQSPQFVLMDDARIGSILKQMARGASLTNGWMQ
jgi:serine/threonine protein kinase